MQVSIVKALLSVCVCVCVCGQCWRAAITLRVNRQFHLSSVWWDIDQRERERRGNWRDEGIFQSFDKRRVMVCMKINYSFVRKVSFIYIKTIYTHDLFFIWFTWCLCQDLNAKINPGCLGMCSWTNITVIIHMCQKSYESFYWHFNYYYYYVAAQICQMYITLVCGGKKKHREHTNSTQKRPSAGLVSSHKHIRMWIYAQQCLGIQ